MRHLRTKFSRPDDLAHNVLASGLVCLPTGLRSITLHFAHSALMCFLFLFYDDQLLFLGPFATLRKVYISLVMFVRLFVRPSFRPHGTPRLSLS